MTAATPDNDRTRAALALPNRQAAAALGVHPGTIRRLRARLGIPAPTAPKGRPLPLRLPAELREALDAEAARLGVPVAEVARRWMAAGGRSGARA